MVRSSDERVPLWVSRGQGGGSIESRPRPRHVHALAWRRRLKQHCQGWKQPSPVSMDDSSDDEPCMLTWKDDDSKREEMRRRADVRCW